MTLSRREILTGIVPLTIGGGLLRSREGDLQEKEMSFSVNPVGRVEKKDEAVQIRIFEEYTDALLGLEQWSHINVLYWFDKNDVPAKRKILRVHPRGNAENPLTGVFACRAPVRPNLIALTVCKVLSVEGGIITIDSIDAFDSTPVLDIKPLIQIDVPREDLRSPGWLGKK